MPRDMSIVSGCYTMAATAVGMAIGVTYIHIGVGSALLVSTNWAMREPRRVRRATGTGSHAFFILNYVILPNLENL